MKGEGLAGLMRRSVTGLMFAAIAVTTWHVSAQLAIYDGNFAYVLGILLGGIAAVSAFWALESPASRPVSLTSLVFVVLASVWLQIRYYHAQGAGMDAWILGLWAPVAELMMAGLAAVLDRERKREVSLTDQIRQLAGMVDDGEERLAEMAGKLADVQNQLKNARRKLAEVPSHPVTRPSFTPSAGGGGSSVTRPSATVTDVVEDPSAGLVEDVMEGLTDTQREQVEALVKLAEGGFRSDAHLAELGDWSESTARRVRKLGTDLGLIHKNGSGEYSLSK